MGREGNEGVDNASQTRRANAPRKEPKKKQQESGTDSSTKPISNAPRQQQKKKQQKSATDSSTKPISNAHRMPTRKNLTSNSSSGYEIIFLGLLLVLFLSFYVFHSIKSFIATAVPTVFGVIVTGVVIVVIAAVYFPKHLENERKAVWSLIFRDVDDSMASDAFSVKRDDTITGSVF
ncbi:hypothetical protein HK100_006365, partial [Physocladia obscura]